MSGGEKKTTRIVIGSLNAENVAYGPGARAGTGPQASHGQRVEGASVDYSSGPDGWEVRVEHPDGRVETHRSAHVADADDVDGCEP